MAAEFRDRLADYVDWHARMLCHFEDNARAADIRRLQLSKQRHRRERLMRQRIRRDVDEQQAFRGQFLRRLQEVVPAQGVEFRRVAELFGNVERLLWTV